MAVNFEEHEQTGSQNISMIQGGELAQDVEDNLLNASHTMNFFNKQSKSAHKRSSKIRQNFGQSLDNHQNQILNEANLLHDHLEEDAGAMEPYSLNEQLVVVLDQV